MKKIFVLGLLIVPIVANATDPVGPSAVPQGQTAVVATVSAPYQTAAPQNGDTTNVVSASYVKGAYNDAIAAINKVNNDKQAKLVNPTTGNNISTVADSYDLALEIAGNGYNNGLPSATKNYFEDKLATAVGVLEVIRNSESRAVGYFQENLQGKLYDEDDNPIDTYVYNADMFNEVITDNSLGVDDVDGNLVTAGGVLQAFQDYTVTAVSTWGSNNTTNVHLTRPINQ